MKGKSYESAIKEMEKYVEEEEEVGRLSEDEEYGNAPFYTKK